MARRKEVTGDTVSFDLPSGILVEIQEIGGHAEKILRNREFLKSGKAIDLFMMDAIVRLNGEPLPESEIEAEKLLMDMKSGDRGYLLLRIRMQSYGEEMIFNYKCPGCKKTSGYQVNFRELLEDGTLKIHPYSEDVPIMLETRSGTAEINYLTGRRNVFWRTSPTSTRSPSPCWPAIPSTARSRVTRSSKNCLRKTSARSVPRSSISKAVWILESNWTA